MINVSRRDALLLLGALTMTTSNAGRAQGAPSLIARPIGKSGEALPIIGLGTWQTFDVGANAEERAPIEAVLAKFVELGGKLVDSSPMYGRSESVVGEIAQKLGVLDKLFLATKVWTNGEHDGVK